MTNPHSLSKKGTLRQRILGFVGTLILISLLGSTLSLYQITEVNRTLDAINKVSIPLGRLLAQMQGDVEVFRRELDRRLGYQHWSDSHWRPRPIPRWIADVLDDEMARASELINKDIPWASSDSRQQWKAWVEGLAKGFAVLNEEAAKLYEALEQKNDEAARHFYPRWTIALEEWKRQVQWGTTEYERSLRQSFTTAESTVARLRTGLEIILVVVVSLSLLLLWLGERALRPMNELTRLVRQIALRGLRREDKSSLPEVPLSRDDEVSQLAREFHNMATALLEREKEVASQKHRLQEQNRMLKEMGALNENVLNSIESILLVTNLEGVITQCNPLAAMWLGKSADQVIGSHLLTWARLKVIPGSELWLSKLQDAGETYRIEPHKLEDRIYGGQIMPLKPLQGEKVGIHGAIVILDDLTEDLDLQERLRVAENLAAVGRMSAQVAHEVRNPLHSIGLEAEVAVELASRSGDHALKQSLQSILSSVDRLEKITENYLKLSRLSAGKRRRVDLGEVLESVLATYAPACEAQGVLVDWSRASNASLWIWADPDLLEQVLGNLMKNALQALGDNKAARIRWSLSNVETGRVLLRIEDNGPGVSPKIQEKLFTPFVTTRAQGTGLGLSFIKKVLEDHGGSIRLVPRAQGGGACFEILLPPAEVAQGQSMRSKEEVLDHA
jgi:nitrogen fixation/metabolism regulation signal transduction histidine kinase